MILQAAHSTCRCSLEEGPHIGSLNLMSSESHLKKGPMSEVLSLMSKRWRWGFQVSISHPQDWFSNHGSSDGSSGTAIMWFHCGLMLDAFHATASGSYHSFHSSIRFLRQVQWHRLYKCKCLIKAGSCKDTSIYFCIGTLSIPKPQISLSASEDQNGSRQLNVRPLTIKKDAGILHEYCTTGTKGLRV